MADFLGARFGDRIGALTTFAYAQLSGVAVLTVAVMVVGAPTSISLNLWLILLGIGIVGAGAYLLLYSSLQVGPVAVASPIASTNGAVAAVLGIVLLHEPLGKAGVVGLGLITVGVVSSSVNLSNLRELAADKAAIAPGAALAILASFTLGSVMFSLKVFGEAISLLMLILAVRTVGGLLSILILARSDSGIPTDLLLQLIAIGIIDAAAFVCFVLGLRTGRVAIVGPISSLFAVVTVLSAWVFSKETLTTTQRMGIVLVLVGVPLLAGI